MCYWSALAMMSFNVCYLTPERKGVFNQLGQTWVRTDEWYDFNVNPRSRVNVLLNLDEDTYSDGKMGDDHPIAWFHEYDGGRSWYTGGGHTANSYSEPAFRAHLSGGLLYAAGLEK